MLPSARFLQEIIDMQRNAQANLPVEPNNGNPRGANNMPQAPASLPEQVGGARFYPWMAPSSSMEFIRQMISSPKASNPPPVTTIPSHPLPQVVFPMRTGGALPASGGVVPPNMQQPASQPYLPQVTMPDMYKFSR